MDVRPRPERWQRKRSPFEQDVQAASPFSFAYFSFGAAKEKYVQFKKESMNLLRA